MLATIQQRGGREETEIDRDRQRQRQRATGTGRDRDKGRQRLREKKKNEGEMNLNRVYTLHHASVHTTRCKTVHYQEIQVINKNKKNELNLVKMLYHTGSDNGRHTTRCPCVHSERRLVREAPPYLVPPKSHAVHSGLFWSLCYATLRADWFGTQAFFWRHHNEV